MSKKRTSQQEQRQGEPELDALPSSWRWSEIETAGAFDRNAIVDGPFGSNLKLSDYVDDGPVPVLTTKNIDGNLDGVRYISREKFEQLRRSAVRPNDILMAKIGSCGKAGTYPSDGPIAIIPANLLKVTVNAYFDRDFVLYYFKSAQFRKRLAAITKATAQPAFGVTEFKRLPLPVAPTAEQRRIVSKIDELFSRIDDGERALEGVQKLVQSCRQSVLKAAVSGELTREWREKYKGQLESGDVLLQRILKARREAWENAALEKMKAKGIKSANDDWKLRYQEPPPLMISAGPKLPEGWVWASLAQLAWSSNYGTSQKCAYRAEGDAVLRIPNIRSGRFEFDDIKNATVGLKLNDRDKLAVGDLLVVRTNGSEDIIGVGAVLLGDAPFSCYFASYLIRFRLVLPDELAEWVNLCWQSHIVREFVNEHKATSAGQYNVSQSSLLDMRLPIPPAMERREIVDQVFRTIAGSDVAMESVRTQTRLACSLRQAVLKVAFNGTLLPQEPDDESAVDILKIIAAERHAVNMGASRRSSGRRTARR